MQYLLCTKNEFKQFSYINSPGSCPHPTQKKKKNQKTTHMKRELLSTPFKKGEKMEVHQS